MLNIRRFFAYLTILLSVFIMQPASKVYGDVQCCSVVQQALKDVAAIKAGMKRRDIEANFKIAGGITFRERTTYVYKNCEYIKVDIDFDRDPDVKEQSSPNDTITFISHLSIDYPAKD